MEQTNEKMVGICGLYCGTCPNYLASRENDTEQLSKIAEINKVSIEEAYCDGCLSDKVMLFCLDCRHGFRTCSKEHRVTWCFECSDFPCIRLEDFSRIHIIDGICHHTNVIQDLQYMKEQGVQAWLRKQDKEGRCPNCDKRLYWFSRECPECNTRIR